MQHITFITGNQKKAEYLSRYLEYPVDHQALDLEEIQSLNLREIVSHKVKQAYDLCHKPILVEDVSLEFESLGGLPGPFIKFFLEPMTLTDICTLLKDRSRHAIARCVFGYFDGQEITLFEGSLPGQIAEFPIGENGYGWDKIFIPDGYDQTRASLTPEDDQKTYLQLKPLAQIKDFLESH